MFVIQSLSLRPSGSANSATLSFSILYAQVRLSSPLFAAIDDWPGYIYVTCLFREKQKQSKENRFSGEKRQRGEELGPARALLSSCTPRLACQRSRINPLPGTPARIIGHNHMWQPAHEPVICAPPAPALCKSRAIVTVWFQVTVSLLTWNAPLSSMKDAHAKYFTRSGWVALGLCLSARALDWLSGRSRREMCAPCDSFSAICVLLAPSTPGIEVHLRWWNCYWKTVDREAITVLDMHGGRTGTLSPPKGRFRIQTHLLAIDACMQGNEYNPNDKVSVMWSGETRSPHTGRRHLKMSSSNDGVKTFNVPSLFVFVKGNCSFVRFLHFLRIHAHLAAYLSTSELGERRGVKFVAWAALVLLAAIKSRHCHSHCSVCGDTVECWTAAANTHGPQ